jgi:hypothetical protein
MGEDSISRQGMEQPVLRMGGRSDLLQRSSKQHCGLSLSGQQLAFSLDGRGRAAKHPFRHAF